MAVREADLKGRRQIGALDEIETDFENIRTAWNWAVQRTDETSLSKMLESLNAFATMRSQLLARKELIAVAIKHFTLTTGGRQDLQWAKLIRPVDFFDFADTREQAKSNAERGLQIVEDSGDQLQIARSLAALGKINYWESNYPAAISFYERSQKLARNLDDSLLVASNLFGLAECHSLLGQHEKAIEFYNQSRDVAQKAGNRHWLIRVLFNLAGEANMASDHNHTLSNIEQGLAIAREIGDRSGIAFGLVNLAGNLLTYSPDVARGKAAAQEALTMGKEVHDKLSETLGSALLGFAAMREGHYSEARSRIEQAEPMVENIPAIHFFMLNVLVEIAWIDNNVVELRRCFSQMGRIAQQYGSPTHKMFTLTVAALLAEKAGQAARAAENVSLIINNPFNPPSIFDYYPPLARFKAQLQAELGPQAWAEAWERGKTLDLDTVFAQELAKQE